MMKILFKAKRIDDGEWIIGDLITTVFLRREEGREDEPIPYILDVTKADYDCFDDLAEDNGIFEVFPETICKYTGLTDKNGMKIWENDLVDFEDTGEEGYEYKEGFDFQNRAVVVWNNGRFELDNFLSDNSEVMELMNNCHEDFWNTLKDCQVIGNIIDNPGLLNSQN
ncbi:YopX family protein [[Clostridium] symbiosum]|uniref:YopX protein domain-containing protein n=2 Tax=Clostridium symbiosum TaxID=1512 RepID=E7GRF1_CLOS6|nr:YopX family protein [[Clostridium] symbiosum]EGA92607.1 hypothetical protein HMPREF9474_03496 [ [[Clostridium] symbiosum WAL-14163]MBT9783694.1 hypothetical protein [[Clostridium] symbiosum]MDB1977917.1 YopX family protein [[Clostridium] symbiosum]MDB1984423.1 YopX family protein [[Clostridium] symbiosum]MDB1988925.1 YopX family protein [[Clostridium] symbiosum]